MGAEWDLDLLKEELVDLSAMDLDFDMSVTGFSVGELDVLLEDEIDPDEEVIPAVPVEPTTRLGDI